MPRRPREKSATGIYHIMLRGIDKREIFISDRDNEKFLTAVFRAKERGKFKLYGYCLMKNHAHLLIEEREEDIGTSIKRITCSYVQYHNVKYARVGHLFQNRFKSETVDTEGYMLTVLRYIHNNPVKANICKEPSDYKWSSYNAYIDSYKGIADDLLDTEFYKVLFETKDKFVSYMNLENDDVCLEYDELKRYTDEELATKINHQYDLDNGNLFQTIYTIYKDTGVSIRQLSNVLGIGKSIVERAIRSERSQEVKI